MATTIGGCLTFLTAFQESNPVTKFANRKTATERIWKAIQSLGGVAPAPEPVPEAEIAVAEPIAQTEPDPESAAPPAISEPLVPAAEPQPEPAAACRRRAPVVVPTRDHAARPPFDEPVASVSAQAPDVAPTTPAATEKATRAKKTPTGETGAPREGNAPASLSRCSSAKEVRRLRRLCPKWDG